MEDVIKIFLSVSYGYGYGYGDGVGSGSGDGDGNGSGYGNGYGYGSGSGYGNGNGYGYGDGVGSGYGDGVGNGSGYGYGVKEYNHQNVYVIDNTETLIDSVHGNYAKGRILNKDLSTTPCYIAKVGNFFAHGSTLKQALADATNKYELNKPIEERIADFVRTYPSLDSVAKHSDLYRLHNTLTGSCTFGRDAFAKERNIDKENGIMTIREFINLTRNAYGSGIIRQLEESYNK